MNFKVNESEQKLSGSYYTPQWISDFVARWICSYGHTNIVEPSCGDGVFFQSFSDFSDQDKRIRLFGMDTDPVAIEKCYARRLNENLDISFAQADFLRWAINNLKQGKTASFDAAVGNPPFIRYQYLEKDVQASAQELFSMMGMKFTKHTNIWLPFVLACVDFLNPGGHIGMVIPAEIINVLYAQGLRQYLLENCSRILLVDPEDLWFEDTLQGAMLILAEKKLQKNDASQICIKRTTGKTFAQTDPQEFFNTADYIPAEDVRGKWTYALLNRAEMDAFNRIKASEYVHTFGELADVDVGIVTGANKFFLVPDSVVQQYHLDDVAHPMFGRSEHCKGIIYDLDQHNENISQGLPTNFLYFENEEQGEIHSDYLSLAYDQGIPNRYKCRIRTPWYKVPSVYSSKVNMLKRSNGVPRLILNRLNAYNTDTAYRITPREGIVPQNLVYCFINSITALSAELEGRFYGGGVLELVPSEIERLITPYIDDNSLDIDQLNRDIKTIDKELVLQVQDEHVFGLVPDISLQDVHLLNAALVRLKNRRQRIDDEASEKEPDVE